MGEMIRRFRTMAEGEGKPADDGSIRMLASTSDAVDWGGWSEVLSHADGAVDDSTCRALLLNHRADMLGGRIEAIERTGSEQYARAIIDPDARMPSGVSVLRSVQSGALRGVSIGYDYSMADTTFDEGTRTLTVNRWRLLEVSLTPIPADPKACVRALPDGVATRSTAAPAAHRKGSVMEPTPKEPQATPAAIPPTIAPAPAGVTADAAAIRGEAAVIARQAKSLGLEPDAFLSLPIAEAREKMLDAVATRGATTAAPRAPATIEVDESDKIVSQAVDAIVARRGRGLFDVAERFEKRTGGQRVSRTDIGAMIAGSIGEAFAPAHKRAVLSSASFTQVTALAAQKVIANGFDGYQPEYLKIARELWDTSFKAVRAAGFQIAAFGAAAGEGNAMADLTVGDGGLALTNEFRGGMIQLSQEAIYNDELGIFFDALGTLGRVGARTIDKSAFAALEAASFANATQVLAFSQAALGTAYTAHAAITASAGEVSGIPAKRLVVPMALYVTARESTTGAPGETTRRIFDVSGADAIVPVKGWYLTDANDWYLLCDPADAAAVYVLRHPDYRVPKIVEVDSGAVPSRKFRIEFPHKAGVATVGTGKPVGGYKCTQP